MKLTYAVLKLLPEAQRAAFKKVDATKADTDDATEYDNGEESAEGLKTALEKEKERVKEQGKKLAEYDTAKAAEIEAARKKALEDARSSGDFKAIEEDYQRQLKELRDANAKAIKDAERQTKEGAISKEVDRLAALFVTPAFAKAAIRERLSCDLVDGEPVVRVKGKDGKASGLSVKDLENEYLTEAEYKGSLAGSKGSGGGSTQTKPTGGGSTDGAGNLDDEKFDAANASGKDLVARIDARRAAAGKQTEFNSDDD